MTSRVPVGLDSRLWKKVAINKDPQAQGNFLRGSGVSHMGELVDGSSTLTISGAFGLARLPSTVL